MLALPIALLLLQGPIPLEKGWELQGDAAYETFEGRATLRMNTGTALRRDLRLLDGTLDVEVRLADRRSFVYVMFRMQDEREFEEMYLRPHKSELPDAVQYAPVYQGASAWQLRHGPGGVAAVRLPKDRWVPLRIVLQGRRAALYVDDMSRPALLVPRLGHEPREGFVGLRAFLPKDAPGSGLVARYANLRVTPGAAADLAALDAPAPPEEPGRVRAWALSGPLTFSEAGVPSVPAMAAVRVAEAEPSGLVEVHRHVGPIGEQRELLVAARVQIRATRAGRRAFDLGFSDRATVFLNGQPIFRGEASYSYLGRREGLIGYDQARLYLPLVEGDNELVVVLFDAFGGMGLMGRFSDPAGLSVEAR